MTLRAPFAPFAPFKIAVMVACAHLSEGILIPVRGGSDIEGRRVITLPDTVDPVAVKDGKFTTTAATTAAIPPVTTTTTTTT
eukprot:gene29239-33977_t